MKEKTEDNDVFEDFFKFAGFAFQSMDTVRSYMKASVSAALGELDLVTREDFERVEAIAQAALERVTELEKKLGAVTIKKEAEKPAATKQAPAPKVKAKAKTKAAPVKVKSKVSPKVVKKQTTKKKK